MAEAGLVKTVVDAIVDAGIKYGIPAAAGFFAGGATLGTIITKLVPRNPVNNGDFRITKEETVVSIEADDGSERYARVCVNRAFRLKLRDDRKQGRFEINIDLSPTEGKWAECLVRLDDDQYLEVNFEKERSIVRAKTPKLTRQRKLDVVLSSTERIAKARHFYALTISNPKDVTTFHWKVQKGTLGMAESARAFAYSEDFDLITLAPGETRNIHQSSHQVTYFITW